VSVQVELLHVRKKTNRLFYDRTTNVDDDITTWILERCKPLAPELLDKNGSFEILALQVGRRPSRRGGPRVQIEWLQAADGAKKFICHNYGHGSSGWGDPQSNETRVLPKLTQIQIRKLCWYSE